ncbi:MAG: tRNA pseudouridine(55) synthase TruB [Acidobacteria bacterium]|nr:tRNA pseudouridine(55) synthase TruB [Acidobacteriota bacterium]MBI3261993.1 tRNA pseudouridine(55) synthase TruB [Acidobacteriota bacterium]
MDGVLVIDKPPGPTSHDVVDIVRRLVGMRRVGHVGTLDPAATGVLPLVIGKATRLARFLAGDRKEYVATLLLGTRTKTFDLEGEVTESRAVRVTPDQVARGVGSMIGTFFQSPPPFSAKKVGGARAYRLARAGAAVAPPPVEVSLFECELLDLTPPVIIVRLVSSAGFYVRALAEDLGQRLGTGACLQALRRTRSGRFLIDTAVPLDHVIAAPEDAARRVIAMADLLPELPGVPLTSEGIRRVSLGQDIGPGDMLAPTGVLAARVRLLTPDGMLVAVAERRPASGFLHPSVVLI